MNRRTLIGRIMALAGAAAVAPSVGTALASEAIRPTYQLLRNADGSVSFVDERNTTFTGAPTREMLDAIADARAEVYGDGWLQATQRAESRAQEVSLYEIHDGERVRYFVDGQEIKPEPPTFEAMQAACEARGCSLDRHENGLGRSLVITHPGMYSPAFQISDYEMATNPSAWLAAVDSWRRGLHDA